jgi:hypothetical protein
MSGEIIDELGKVVYRCLKHGAVMKPVNIKSRIEGAYVHIQYEIEVCSECINRRVPIMFTVEPNQLPPQTEEG